eukprot:1154605-Pelagomonas_calceolata.AAC.9
MGQHLQRPKFPASILSLGIAQSQRLPRHCCKAALSPIGRNLFRGAGLMQTTRASSDAFAPCQQLATEPQSCLALLVPAAAAAAAAAAACAELTVTSSAVGNRLALAFAGAAQSAGATGWAVGADWTCKGGGGGGRLSRGRLRTLIHFPIRRAVCTRGAQNPNLASLGSDKGCAPAFPAGRSSIYEKCNPERRVATNNNTVLCRNLRWAKSGRQDMRLPVGSGCGVNATGVMACFPLACPSLLVCFILPVLLLFLPLLQHTWAAHGICFVEAACTNPCSPESGTQWQRGGCCERRCLEGAYTVAAQGRMECALLEPRTRLPAVWRMEHSASMEAAVGEGWSVHCWSRPHHPLQSRKWNTAAARRLLCTKALRHSCETKVSTGPAERLCCW